MSAGLMGFILMGILTTFLFLGRSSANMVNYAEMELEARKGLETFAVDTRQASEIDWVDSQTIILSVNGTPVTYGYNADAKTFYRSVAGVERVLVKNVTTFELRGYQINSNAQINTSNLTTVADRAAVSNVTKQVQISMRAVRSQFTLVGATNSVFSARYILRNKKVTT